MADVRNAAIVKDVILWGSIFPAAPLAAAKTDLDFDACWCWRLVVAPILRLDCRRRVGPSLPWRLTIRSSWRPPILPDPPSGSNVAASLLLFGHFFLRAVALRGNKLEVRRPQGQLSAVAKRWNSGWSLVRATPTLRSKLTSAGARKVRKKFGNVHGRIKTDTYTRWCKIGGSTLLLIADPIQLMNNAIACLMLRSGCGMKFYQLLKTVISFIQSVQSCDDVWQNKCWVFCMIFSICLHSKTAFCNSTNLSDNKNNFKTFQGYPTYLLSRRMCHICHVTCVTCKVSRKLGKWGIQGWLIIQYWCNQKQVGF